ERRLNGRDLLRKVGLKLSIQRRSRFALLEGVYGIDRRPVLRHLEVKMRPRGKPGLADKSHQLSLLDRLSRANPLGNVRQMCIPTRQPTRVFDTDEISVTVVPTCKRYRTIRDGYHRTP